MKAIEKQDKRKNIERRAENDEHYGTTINETEIYDEYAFQSEQYMKQDKRNQKEGE
jgi:hypothetical protein